MEEPKKNIFDLHALANEVKEIEVSKSNVIGPGEQEKLLENYAEVPKDKWEKIPVGSHVRYLRKDGGFRSGGFIQSMWSKIMGDQQMSYFQLGKYQNSKKNWKLPLISVDKLWVSNVGIENPKIKEDISANAEDLEYLKSAVEQLKADMSKMNNEQNRILNLIKKLHKLGSH